MGGSATREYLVTEEQGTARRLFLPLKNNLAGDRIGCAFEVVGTAVNGIPTSAVAWSSEPVTTSADEALAAAGKRKASSDAVEFVEDALREGPMDQTKIEQIGAEAGFTPKTLRTARESLGVITRKEGSGGMESGCGFRPAARPWSAWW